MMIRKNEFVYRMPTIEELYALEHEARRLRAEAISAFLRDSFRALKGAFSRTAPAPSPRNMRHA